MNHSATKNKAPTMSIKNIFSPTPHKISPDPSPANMNKENTEALTWQTLLHTPVYDSTKKLSVVEIAAPARPQKKPAHPHRKSVASTKCRAAAAVAVDRRALLQTEEERILVRKLRKIKRRLFLEAVNPEQPIPIKSPRSVVRQELTGKQSRTGKE
mmetsp:Transcript_26370/g.47788  ORF Transcript_26370/g.47788 Transcript_26370/m.47788 type:complete len:156 (+) Transcript_26370:49-516(+)